MTNIEIEFQALLCEQNGMLAENEYRSHFGQGVAYTDADFGKLANQIRALKTVEPGTQATNSRYMAAHEAVMEYLKLPLSGDVHDYSYLNRWLNLRLNPPKAADCT